ncbi:hypothetical protein [Falsiroseomonas sp. CW058]|uniref:hypothetical protein n=1 Tax=Falsiroseomonas sp. CW058 TaxID=3388664 RepID=UPI003D31E46C
MTKTFIDIAPADVRSDFQKLNNDANHFIYPLDQGQMLRELNRERGSNGEKRVSEAGVCRALALYFIHFRLNPPKASSDPDFGGVNGAGIRFTRPFAEFALGMGDSTAVRQAMIIQDVHAKVHATKLTLAGKHPISTRNRGDLDQNGDKMLGNKGSIIKEMFNPPGLYYLALRNFWNTTGHAIAFDTRGPVIMFDANSGWWQWNDNPTAQGSLAAWFPKYYKAIGYKKNFLFGNRHLVQFG